MITNGRKILVYLLNLNFLIQIYTNPIINVETSAVSSNRQKGESTPSTYSKFPNIASFSKFLQKNDNDREMMESVELYTKRSLSKILNLKNAIQQNLIRTSEFSPIIETDKINSVNNNGSMPMLNIPRGIINTYEAFSNFVNWLIEKPKDAGRFVSKAITHNLDNIGHKLVGL